MKRKLSVTIEESSIEEIEDRVLNGTFRNKSHFVEIAVNKLLKGRK